MGLRYDQNMTRVLGQCDGDMDMIQVRYDDLFLCIFNCSAQNTHALNDKSVISVLLLIISM
jgi:hypothetical protein